MVLDTSKWPRWLLDWFLRLVATLPYLSFALPVRFDSEHPGFFQLCMWDGKMDESSRIIWLDLYITAVL